MTASISWRRPDPLPPARMRCAVLGDIHSNLEALTAVVEDAQNQQCTHYACVGDIVGYNANPIECLRMVRDLGMRCVKGNHDEYCSADQTPQNFSPRAAAAVLWTQQRLADADKDWLRNLKYT